MALSFPNSPSVGDIHEDSASGFSYQWSGELWKSYKVEISDSLGGNLDADLSLNSNDITGTGDVDITGNLKISGIATASSFVGNLTGDVTGNAATATQLETARTIGGVSFNGTSNINLPGVNATGNQDTSGNAATATALETARTIGGVSFDGTSNINLPGVNATGNQNTSGTAAGLTGSPSITVTDITASGDITVGGTLTYEDVSNVDSVGLITARTGVRVTTGGIEVSAGGLDVTGVTTSTSFVKSGGTSSQFLKADGSVDSSTYITSADGGNATTLDSLDSTQFLRSDAADTKTSGDLSFSDSVKAIFGGGNDLQIYHDGSHSYILDNGTGAIKIKGDDIRVENAAGRNILKATSTATELYFDNGSSSSKKLETTTSGVTITGDVNSTSDINLKKDIEVITDAADLVKQLSGVKFTWKENDEKSAGVIAQDIEKVLPELVSGNEGEKSVNYSGLIGVLIEAVKEQQTQIEELKQEIKELKGKS